MAKRHEVSEDEWAILDSVIPKSTAATGRPARDRREMLNGLLWILCTGAQWRDLPERPWYQGFHNIVVADDNRTTLCILLMKEGKELFILRWVVYEGHLYISPEKAPDPKTGIFKPWILRTKVK